MIGHSAAGRLDLGQTAGALDISTSTAFRLVFTLEKLGYLER
jgi:DNA-binding IclR family transcriptional regulator|tara:strand:- start:244 stop:369 length:126 start_codon:yes stop_codon:yes gene_type:complete